MIRRMDKLEGAGDGLQRRHKRPVPANLLRRPPTPAKDRGRLQRSVRYAFAARPVLSSTQIYNTAYCRQRLSGKRLTWGERLSVWRVLIELAEPVGRADTIGRPYLWRLRNDP